MFFGDNYVLPVHFDEICVTLCDVRRDVEAAQTDSVSCPRVLVIGETSGVVSSMFLLAGADVATYPKKVEAVRSIDPRHINSLEKVRSFLGLCSYYRRFIKGFAHIAAPLTDLTRTGVDVATISQSPEGPPS